jgi:putative transposase
MNCHAMRDPLRRLDRAFAAFFRRVQGGQRPGYPRFRARRRYDSLSWDDGWALRDRRLALQGVGHLKVKWHRALPESGVVRRVTVRRVAGRWYASFTLQKSLPALTRPDVRPAVGVDLGICAFAALSTGERIPGPRAYRAEARGLRVAQRLLARRGKGSHRRQKARLLLARRHERVRNLRRDHAHKLTRRLVSDFGPLAERTHRCTDCGLVLDRDVNAARNLLRLGLSRQASTWPAEGVRSLRRHTA